MNKGLEAIKRIKWKLEDEGILGEEYELCDIIEKELKVLEIITKYIIDTEKLMLVPSAYFYNNFGSVGVIPIAQEEYDLLKEVLL